MEIFYIILDRFLIFLKYVNFFIVVIFVCLNNGMIYILDGFN